MNGLNRDKLGLERELFSRSEIERRMEDGGFNSISRIELFIWDLEMFLQFQKKLGDNVSLKGGAATQFYIPINSQRTSIDIDMLCSATQDEVRKAISEIESELNGEGDYYKFRKHEPKDPRVRLDTLATYYVTVDSICNSKELFSSNGRQEVKIEFLFSDHKFTINKIKNPELFIGKTKKEFYVLPLEHLFADKLSTFGPVTIGIPDERADEHFKQIYDVITLFNSNRDQIFREKESIKASYKEVARRECQIRNIPYEENRLFEDMKGLINRIKNIETQEKYLQLANNFQSLYLRKNNFRDKSQWAIAGYILDLLLDYIFREDERILQINQIDRLIERLKFNNIQGPEKGVLIRSVRGKLENEYSKISGLSDFLFAKRLERIIWELVMFKPIEEIQSCVSDFK